MKSLITFAFLFISFISFGQSYVFKTVPKTFEDEIGQSRTIIGITARILGPIEVSLKHDSISQYNRTFYIAFQLSDSTFYGARNANSLQFVERAVGNGMPMQTAIANIKAVIQALEFGTKQQIYAAGSQLSLIYGHTLKPFNEQDQ